MFIGADAAAIGIYGCFMMYQVACQLSSSVTTNDMIAKYKYPWFATSGDAKSNLYDYGTIQNWFTMITGDIHKHKTLGGIGSPV